MSAEEKQHITTWKDMVGRKLNWSADAEIRQRDFEYLSREIAQKTSIELSTTTLRRIWSNQYKQVPQVHTLNAMARFLDFEDWNDLKQEQTRPSVKDDSAPSTAQVKLFWPWVVAVILVLGLVALLSFDKREAEGQKRFTVSLKADQTNYHGVPATAGFQYDIAEAPEPVMIELSWNPYERVELDPTNNFYTGVYYYPDYHRTKLLMGDSVLASIPVHVTTDDWHALIMREANDVKPLYVIEQDFIREGQMGFGRETMDTYLLEAPEALFSVFTWSNEWLADFDGGDFTFEATWNNIADKTNPACAGVDVLFKAENGNARIPIKNTGCYGESVLFFGDRLISGKTENLSALTTEIYEEQQLKVQVSEKEVTLTLNDQVAYTFSYKRDMGSLKVVKFIFTGLGSVDAVSLTSGEQHYVEDFETGLN